MTASAGLHNLPSEMRPAIAAEAGHVFVRADLGQIEPRVLAAVSGDEAFIAATQRDDLYREVAQQLDVTREVAKLGDLDQNANGVDLLAWWAQIISSYSAFTALFNTTGQPAIMLPLWQAKSGLPLAMHFAGRLGDEETLYSLAGQLEQALPWVNRRPPLYG